MNKWPSIAGKLKEARQLLELTQKEAAEASGMHQPHLSDMENNDKAHIPVRYIQFLFENGVDLNSLLSPSPVREMTDLERAEYMMEPKGLQRKTQDEGRAERAKRTAQREQDEEDGVVSRKEFRSLQKAVEEMRRALVVRKL